MKYYISMPDLDAQISEIRRKIMLSMNGIVSEQMTEKGILYKKNYGVSVPRIKEIAAAYSPSHDLAQRLWNLQIRETMILASLLEPSTKFTIQLANEWSQDFNQIELVEQVCLNLYSRLSFATQLCTEWIHSENIWIQISGFILAARVYIEFNQEQLNFIIQKAIQVSTIDNFHLYKAIALCLGRFCRIDKETAFAILSEINEFQAIGSNGQHYIIAEVKQEMLFLGIL
ncbi:MAG: DNA alkylation repair protein [Paludibacter sp.]